MQEAFSREENEIQQKINGLNKELTSFEQGLNVKTRQKVHLYVYIMQHMRCIHNAAYKIRDVLLRGALLPVRFVHHFCLCYAAGGEH